MKSTPSAKKRGLSVARLLIPSSRPKTHATAEGEGKKGQCYKPLPTRFRRHGFSYRQIAREGDCAIYEQCWNGCSNPTACYEVIRIRLRDRFRIGEKFIEAHEVYPKPEAWGADGFTLPNKDAALAKLHELLGGSTSTASLRDGMT